MAPQNYIIRPPMPLAPEIMALAPSDQFIIRNFVTTVLCFKLDIDCLLNEIVADLKEGIANTINEIPFLAGTLRRESEERCSLHVDIPEDGGVEFKVKDLRHLTGSILYDYDQLLAAGVPPSKLDFDTLVAGTLIPPPEPVCLSVQANFVRGGLLLTTHMHHAVMDGSGLFTLFKCLAKHTAAASRSEVLHCSKLIPEECLDRGPLQLNPSRRKMTDYPGFRPAQELSWAPKADAASLMARLVVQSKTDSLKKVEKSWWIMSPDQIQGLEREIMSGNPGGIKPSLNSIMSAFFWRHISLGRDLTDCGVSNSGLLTVCDFRSRIEPSLPADYAGNALVFAKTNVSVQDLCSPDPKKLYETALKITESVNWWDSERIEGLLAAVEGTSDMRSVEWDCDSHFGVDIQVTSTLGASSPYELDWGNNLGQMQALRFPTGAFYDGFVTVLPRMPDGSVEFVLNGGAAILERLTTDPVFTRYARFLCR